MPVRSLQELIHLPVYTKMGTHLGQLIDVECDTDEYTIINFLVQQKGIVGGFKNPLVINRTQVLEILNEKIIVEDAVSREGVVA